MDKKVKTKVYKEVLKYKPKYFGLTIRQLISLTITVIVSGSGFIINEKYIYLDKTMNFILNISLMFIPLSYGFILTKEKEQFEELLKKIKKFIKQKRFTYDGDL